MDSVKTLDTKRTPCTAVIALVAVAAALALTGLGHVSFWDDESFVGIVARNLANTGHLTVWDGRNIYGPSDGGGLSSDLRNPNPPLDTILAAISFKLLGVSNFAGRLPFALCAVGTVIALIFLLRRVAPGADAFHLYCASALVFSVSFLLYARTCRYYALSMLLAVAVYLTYRKFLESSKPRELAALWILAVLLFYCHYMVCAAFLAALAVTHIVFHRTQIAGRQWILVGASIALFAAVTVPYAIASHIQDFSYGAARDPWIVQRVKLIWWNFRDANLMAVLPWMLGVLLVVALARMRYKPTDFDEKDMAVGLAAREIATITAGYIFFLAMLSPQSLDTTVIADIRYQAPVIPFMAVLTGAALWFVHRRAPIAALVVLALTACTNIFTLAPQQLAVALPYTSEFRWLLPAFIQEETHPYPTANEKVAQYLRANASQDDSVINAPTFEDYPMIFYVGDKIKVCCQLDHNSPIPQSVVAKMNAPMYYEDNFPDWIVAYSASRVANNTLAYFSRPHVVAGQTVARSYNLVDTLDIYCDQTNRPELPKHHFGPVTDFDRQRFQIYIFHGGLDVPVNASQ